MNQSHLVSKQPIITGPSPSLWPRPADRPGAEGRPPPHAGPPHRRRQEEARLLQRLSAEVQLAGEQSPLSDEPESSKVRKTCFLGGVWDTEGNKGCQREMNAVTLFGFVIYSYFNEKKKTNKTPQKC